MYVPEKKNENRLRELARQKLEARSLDHATYTLSLVSHLCFLLTCFNAILINPLSFHGIYSGLLREIQSLFLIMAISPSSSHTQLTIKDLATHQNKWSLGFASLKTKAGNQLLFKVVCLPQALCPLKSRPNPIRIINSQEKNSRDFLRRLSL